jgi:Uma2 family endonuclease
MSTQPKHLLTPEEYLEIDRKAEYKSEYYNGEMFAMSGGVSVHNLISGHLVFLLNLELRSRPCFVYNSDMRVRVSRTGLYTYPDVTVVCSERQFLDDRRDTLLNPTVIVEALLPSTEAYDRGRKFEHYRSLESLRAYLMFASDRIHCDLFTRESSGSWVLTEADGPDATIDLEAIGCRLKLGEVYEKAAAEILQPPTTGSGLY